MATIPDQDHLPGNTLDKERPKKSTLDSHTISYLLWRSVMPEGFRDERSRRQFQSNCGSSILDGICSGLDNNSRPDPSFLLSFCFFHSFADGIFSSIHSTFFLAISIFSFLHSFFISHVYFSSFKYEYIFFLLFSTLCYHFVSFFRGISLVVSPAIIASNHLLARCFGILIFCPFIPVFFHHPFPFFFHNLAVLLSR